MSGQVDVLTRRELLTGALGLAAAGGRAAAALRPGRAPVVLGYYPRWTKLPPEKLDLALYTHVCHAFAEAKPGGPVTFPTDEATRNLIAVAHRSGLKVLLSLGGADSNAGLVSQPTGALADALAGRAQAFGYDGIDVDWEGPTSKADGGSITALVLALRERLPHALLTMAVPAEDWDGRWFDSAALQPAVDWLNVMTYDFAGPWSRTVGHNASMTETVKGIEYWQRRGWPARKLALGIPNYGRRMAAARFGAPAPPGTYEGGEISYMDLQPLLAQGWTPAYDSAAQAPYLVKPGGGELVTYDNETSARRKAQWAGGHGLLGYFFWEITEDFDGKTNVLARAARAGWGAARSASRPAS